MASEKFELDMKMEGSIIFYQDQNRYVYVPQQLQVGRGSRVDISILRGDSGQKTASSAQQAILQNMVKLMESCNVQGFVFGIIPECGKPVTGASENLKDWWQDQVKFGRNGPAAATKFDWEKLKAADGNGGSQIFVAASLPENLQDATLGYLLSRRLRLDQPCPRGDSGRRTASSAQHDILKNLVMLTKSCNPQGFVFGIIPECGKPVVGGASANLKDWWEDQVRFSHNGPAAAAKYEWEKLEANGDSGNPILDASLTENLMKLQDATLGHLLSTLMPNCYPSQRCFPFEKKKSPPWWPTGEDAWFSQLDTETRKRMKICQDRVPYKKPHDLKKSYKAMVLTSVIKQILPDIFSIHEMIRNSKCLQEKMTARESVLLNSILEKEEIFARDMYPHSSLAASAVRVQPSLLVLGESCSYDVGFRNGPTDANLEPRGSETRHKVTVTAERVQGSGQVGFGTSLNFPIPAPPETKELSPVLIRKWFPSDAELEDKPGYRFTCSNIGCPHSNYCLGFYSRSERNNHQIVCEFGDCLLQRTFHHNYGL